MLTIVWSITGTGLLDTIGIDADIARKWRPSLAPVRYSAYTKPSVPTGEIFKRRVGRRVETGPILAAGAEARGITNHPYGDDPPVRIEFGRYGFRSEYPGRPGGMAIIGASYTEAAFANAEDTIPGWLNRDHGIAAANFGIAFAGPFNSLHVLERYVAPERPAEIVWTFSGRASFERIVDEARRLREQPGASDVTPRVGFVPMLAGTASGFLESALLRGRLVLHRWAPSRVERMPEAIARLQPVANSPHASISLAGEEVPVDVAMQWMPQYARIVPPLLAEALGRMLAQARAIDANLRVVYLPSRFELFEGRWVEPPVRQHDLPDLFAILERECRKLGIPAIDTTAALRAALDDGVLVVNPIHDQHLSAAGMRVVARLIAER